MFVWWEAPISTRVEWKCASMTSGGQCVMIYGTALMLLWCANSWDMLSQEVSTLFLDTVGSLLIAYLLSLFVYIGGRAFSNAHFGIGSGPIFLDDVQCTSSSSQLLECPSRPILSHNCLHSDDAGVGCEGNPVWEKNELPIKLSFFNFHFCKLTPYPHL